MAHCTEACALQYYIIAHHKKKFVYADDTSFYTSILDRCVAEAADVDDYIRIFCNSTGGSKGKGVASDNGNGVGGISNYVVIDKEKCVDGDECFIEVKECEESELIGKRVSSLDATFEAYNEYAFHKGFSIRCDKLRRREGSQEVHQGSFLTVNKVLKGVRGKKIRHLQNGAGGVIVQLMLHFTLNQMGNRFLRSVKWFIIMNCF